MVNRIDHIERLEYLLAHFPVVAILGARQVGKTTLALDLANRSNYLSSIGRIFA